MMKKQILAGSALLAAFMFFYFDLGQYLTLNYFMQQRQAIEYFTVQHELVSAVIYFVIYVLVTALSLPAASVMTLVGGALFGFGWGLLLVSFASSVGAALAFALARGVLREVVQNRFSVYFKKINSGVEKEGGFYLFSLRLVPLIPFVAINLVMGLTSMKIWTFYWVSQLGMLAGTMVYVNAGTQLAQIDDVGEILTPSLIGSFLLLGIFPWVAKAIVAFIKSQKIVKQFKKPKHFDNNLLVIGAGSAGLVSSYIAATTNAKVTLIEKNKMGGDCLNTGCVPSKAFIRSSRINHYVQTATRYGLKTVASEVDFAAVMKRVQAIINTIEPHDCVKRYSDLGVNCLQGAARIVSPWQVSVDGKTHSARNIIIATGARPTVPNIIGINDIDYLTSDSVWQLQELPKQMVVIGGGPIACELAQAFHRLGSKVVMVIRSELLPKEDTDVVEQLETTFSKEGIVLFKHSSLTGVKKINDKVSVCFSHKNETHTIIADQLLLATGRTANTENVGLENVGIECTEQGTVQVDDYLRTACPTIYACGDVVGPYQFTHVASHQAWYATVNSLFGFAKKFKVDYSVIPWVTFTDPELARVGLNEKEAKEKNIAYEITQYDLNDLDRAITDSQAHGFVKILTQPGKDRILGVTIVGYHASEQIVEYILAMRYRLGLNKILNTIHIYPTMSEANKYAAGNWKKNHKPEMLLRWVEKIHRWRR